MNINFQKIVKYATSAAAVCAILLSSLVIPSYAAIAAYDPDDYISDVVVNGDTKKVSFNFSDIPSLVDVWENPSSTKTKFSNVTGTVGYRAELDGTTSLRFRVFLLGVETWDNNRASPGSVIDISDIMPGANIDMSMTFALGFTRIPMVGSGAPAVDSLHVGFNFGFYMYDHDGNYLGVKWGTGSNSVYTYGQSASTVFNPSYQYNFASNVRYVCPFLDLQCEDDISIFDWRFEVSPKNFTFSTNINMIYEDSVTMDRIQDKLGDIDQGIQDVIDKLDDTNDKLDDTNDKLDDIISGGQAAEDVKPDNDKLTGSTNDLDDANEEMDDAAANIPTAPTDLGSLIDDEVLDKALSNGEKVFDWDAMGLTRMFPPLGLSCGLSVLFYVIFGKKG